MKVGDLVTLRAFRTLEVNTIGVIIDSRVASPATPQAQADCVNSHFVYWSLPAKMKDNPRWIMERDLEKEI